MNIQTLHLANLNLMRQVKTGYLSTNGLDGYPQTRAMINIRHSEMFALLIPLFNQYDDCLTCYFHANTSSHKITQLTSNIKGNVCYSDFKSAHNLLLIGDLSIVTDQHLRTLFWQDRWTSFYPEGASDQSYTLIKLSPVKAKGSLGVQLFSYALPLPP